VSVECYRVVNFKKESRRKIVQINDICEEYGRQKLTARQVYYQFVSRGWLENSARNYKNLTNLLTDARYAGLVDWDIIEDRGRTPDIPPEWNNLGERVEMAIENFRLPRWVDQTNYVEVWVEKQALAGVLEPITWRWHVPLMVNKGYSSASAMKEAADRIKGRVHSARPPTRAHILYLGDHDPSGEDMVRDVKDRLTEFGVPRLKVHKVALTWEQIQLHKPPPNPAKLTDSRATAYIEKFGDESWELDALPPRELNRLVTASIQGLLDFDKMKAVISKEDEARAKLKKVMSKIKW
jgi:hypothetical protein